MLDRFGSTELLMLGGMASLLGGRLSRRIGVWRCAALLAVMGAIYLEAVGAPGAATIFNPPACRWLTLGVAALLLIGLGNTDAGTEHAPEAFGLTQLAAAATLSSLAGTTLVELWLSFELLAFVCACLLLVVGHRSFRFETFAQWFAAGLWAGLFTALGLGILYGVAGSLDLAALHKLGDEAGDLFDPTRSAGGRSLWLIAGALLLMAGTGARMGVAPFHLSVSSALTGAGMWGEALIGTFPLIAGAALLTATLSGFAGESARVVQGAAGILAVFTLIAAAVRLAAPHHLQRWLVGLIMLQTGCSLAATARLMQDRHGESLGLSDASNLPSPVELLAGGLIAHAIALSGLCLLLVSLEHRGRPMRYLDDLRGLATRSPATAAGLLICLASLAGVPPSPGFWNRLWLLASCVSVHGEPDVNGVPLPEPGFLLLAAGLAIAWLGAGFGIARAAAVLLFAGPFAAPAKSGGKLGRLAGWFCAALLILGGVLPGWLWRLAADGRW